MSKTLLPSLLCLVALAGLAALAQAQTAYRWVDSDGRIHYSDQPPPPSARNAEQKNLGGNVIDTSGLPYALRNAVDNFPVTMYSAPDCTDPCVSARDFLNRRKIPFTEKSIRTRDDGEAYKMVMGSTDVTVPGIVVGSRKAIGYLDSEWNALLDAAGYPNSTR